MPDLLSDIISTIELRSTLYFRAELTAPFSIAVPEDSNVIRFHVANAGPCYVSLKTGEYAMMQAGDLVLVSRGAAHILRTPARSVRRLWPTCCTPPASMAQGQCNMAAAGPGRRWSAASSASGTRSCIRLWNPCRRSFTSGAMPNIATHGSNNCWSIWIARRRRVPPPGKKSSSAYRRSCLSTCCANS